MTWEVEFTDEFELWWDQLTEDEQERIDWGVRLLEARGPGLPFPYSSHVKQSRHPAMRELRVQVQGRPFRVFYIFDPRRAALLLIGGDKTGNDQFYEELVPAADRIYDQHLLELGRERK